MSGKNVVKTIHRRNSTVSVVNEHGILVVEKQYHAHYKVAEEALAYSELQRLLEPFPGIRAADVLGVNAAANCIRLEYVSGISLWDSFGASGVQVFDGASDLILSTLAAAARQNLRFDSAPEHYLWSSASNEWVLIDPVCDDLDLNHFSAIVFLQGMFRCFVKQRRQWWTIGKFIRCWKSYFRKYRVMAGITQQEMNREMCSYVDRVIEWNRQPNETETLTLRMARRVIIIPFWMSYKAIFYFNWIR